MAALMDITEFFGFPESLFVFFHTNVACIVHSRAAFVPFIPAVNAGMFCNGLCAGHGCHRAQGVQ